MKLASVLLAVGCWLSAASALQPGFDAREVVRQMRSVARPPSGVERPELDDGEFLIDTSGIHYEGDPAVAFDGANFLVVWEDGRDDDIYGARVTPGGMVLDPFGFVISQAADLQFFSALAFDGTNFLVVWEDARSGNFDIYGARVTPAGTVLDPEGFAISQEGHYQLWPAIAFDGTNFLAVWEDYRNDDDIYGARVTPGGTVLDPSGFVISPAAGDQQRQAISFDGANFLVVWQDTRDDSSDIYGARVTPQGAVLDPSGFVISQAGYYQLYPALAFDGANFLVVWEDYLSDVNYGIHGARVTPAGTVLDPSGFVISQGGYYQEHPALAFDGTNFLVTWEDGRGKDFDIYAALVTQGGVVLDVSPVVKQDGGQYLSGLARGAGSQMFLVYQGWAGNVNGKTYNKQRVWGKVNPMPGVAETMNDERGTLNAERRPDHRQRRAAAAGFSIHYSHFTIRHDRSSGHGVASRRE